VGFDAIELEDQLLPRRFHHHVGVEHLVPPEFMISQIREAIAARSDPDFLIIGRTNARRRHDMDEPCGALRPTIRPAPTCFSCTHAIPTRCA
jgi:2-methylisocitrate lyase-like PEP mutase family enzyme